MAKQFVLSEKDYLRIQQGLRDIDILKGRMRDMHRRRNINPGGFAIKIFVVVEAADSGGDGVYKCWELTLDATEWEDTAGDPKFDNKNTTDIEVLNIHESNPVADYSPALCAFDYMAAWRMTDDEGHSRWVGIPLDSGEGRRAKTIAAAPAFPYIYCNIISSMDTEIVAPFLGANVKVHCNIAGGGNLNKAIPRLPADFEIMVKNQQGKWWCTSPFQAIADNKGLDISGGKLVTTICEVA